MTWTAAQATNRWHHEKTQKKVPQDQVRAPGPDGLAGGGDLITRLGVIKEDYKDAADFQSSKQVLQTGNRKDKPTNVQVDDYKNEFKQARFPDLVEDDDFAAGLASSSSSQVSNCLSGSRQTVSKLGGSVQAGVSTKTAKKVAKIKSMAVLDSVVRWGGIN